MKKEETSLPIVKYDNSFNTLALKNFTSVEMDLLMALCSKAREQGTAEIILSFDQLKDLSSYSSTSKERFVRDIEHTNEKLLGLKFKINNENKITQFTLFPTFEMDLEKKTLTIAVNQKFAYILNQLNSNFTRFELREFASLRSTYSKTLYRLLKQYRSTGIYKVSIENFRLLLEVPESYSIATMNRDILNKAIKELTPYFKELKVEKVIKKKAITALIFTFKPESNELLPQKTQTDTKGAEATQTCPKCGKSLYQRVINGNYAWVHLDGKLNGECDALYNTVAEIQGYEEIPNRGNKKENVSIVNELKEFNLWLKNQREEIEENTENFKTIIYNNLSELKETEDKITDILRAKCFCRLSSDKSAMFDGEVRTEKEIEEIENLLKIRREEILKENNIDEKLLTPPYKCNKCKDTCEDDNGQACSCRPVRFEEFKKIKYGI